MIADLSDKLTILIAAKVDSDDRKTNLKITLDYINHHFNVPIILSEQDTSPQLDKICNERGVQYVFYQTDNFFNRQRGVNICANLAQTPVVAHYDADILLKPKQLKTAVKIILDQKANVVYPYNGHFYDVPKLFHSQIVDTKSLDCVDISQCQLFNSHSVGGVVLFNRKMYWKNGGANENFKGLGYEDSEIFERFKILGTKFGRVPGPLYHLTHKRVDTSYDHNPHIIQNRDECLRIQSLSPVELNKEISNWYWVR